MTANPEIYRKEVAQSSNERTQLLTAKLNQGKTVYETGLVHV